MTRALIRLPCAIFCWLTAAYAFTSASAFTYQELIRPRMFGTGAFSEWHAVLYWPWLALMLLDLRGALRDRGIARLLALGFAVCWSGVGFALAVYLVLPRLTDDSVSILVGSCALLPLVWTSAIDYARAGAYLRRQRPDVDPARRADIEGRWLTAALAA